MYISNIFPYLSIYPFTTNICFHHFEILLIFTLIHLFCINLMLPSVIFLLLLDLTQIYCPFISPIILILTSLQLYMLHTRIDPPAPRHTPILPSSLPLTSNPHNKNSYIGLTLKEYFHIADSSNQLHEIDEENHSEVSSGTPCFGGQGQKASKERPYRRNRNKTELQEIITGNQIATHKANHKMATLSLEEFGIAQKNAVKLPSIHEQRHKNNSRQGLLKDTKDLKSFEKRENVKGKAEDTAAINLALFAKKQDKDNAKANLSRNIINVRRGIKSRVTSTSFYHMNMREKERDRVKTEEEIESGLQKSFVITRYGGMMRSNKNREDMALLKKYENSFKLTKH